MNALTVNLIGQGVFTFGFIYGDNFNLHESSHTDFELALGQLFGVLGILTGLVFSYLHARKRKWYLGYKHVFRLSITLLSISIVWGIVLMQYVIVSILASMLF